MKHEITVVDYGVGNLFSVCKALEHCGASVKLASSIEDIITATKLILPGVGAFGDGISMLTNLGMDDAIKEYAGRGGFLLGICLGMQFLLDSSEEFGCNDGLGLIRGKVIPIPPETNEKIRNKIPHIGWNNLIKPLEDISWDNTILASIENNSPMYFVHSYMAKPSDPAHCLAECVYGGTHIPAVIGSDNVFGVQFHPEKSGSMGLRILRDFMEL